MPLDFDIDTTTNSRFLRPKSGRVANVDVVNDFAWTLSPKSARTDVPYASLTEYQQTTGQLVASFAYYQRVVSSVATQGVEALNSSPTDPTEVFRGKYIATPTGFVYRFPYFSSQKHRRTTNFSGESSESPFKDVTDLGKSMLPFKSTGERKGVANKISSMLGGISTFLNTGLSVANSFLPGSINFEFPQTWTGTDDASITIQFHLFNIGTVEDISDNRNLAHLLTYQNSPNRRNFAIVDPTVIYSLYIPDVVNFPACYMDSLDIRNVGNTRIMKFNEIDRIIPEAYEFNMTFKSLFVPTRNVMGELNAGRKVQAITVEDLPGGA
jgi:hypothetical protein